MKMAQLPLKTAFVVLFSFLILSCNGKKEKSEENQNETAQEDNSGDTATESSLPLDRLNLPEGFKIDIYADGIGGNSVCGHPK